MSSFNFTRRAFVLTALASCGFEPVLQSDTLARLRGKIALPEAKDRPSYIMRRELTKHFGMPNAPEYQLSFDYKTSTRKLAVTTNNTITRSRLTATGMFRAELISTGEMIMQEPFKRVASYSSNSNRYASDRARVSTEERLIVSLAQDFSTRFINAVKEA